MTEVPPRSVFELQLHEALGPQAAHVPLQDTVRILFLDGDLVYALTWDHEAHQRVTDLPAGPVLPGESPEDAARRVADTQLGLRSVLLHPLGTMISARASASREYQYLAYYCDGTPASSKTIAVGGQAWHTDRLPIPVHRECLQWNRLLHEDRLRFRWLPLRQPEGVTDASTSAALLAALQLMTDVGGPVPADSTSLEDRADAAADAVTQFPEGADALILVWLGIVLSRYENSLTPSTRAALAAVRCAPRTETAWQDLADRLRDDATSLRSFWAKHHPVHGTELDPGSRADPYEPAPP